MQGRAAYVLVGGKSSRFGRDKALIEVDGKPLAAHVAGIADQVADHVTFVGDPTRYEHLGLPVIPDAVLGFGPAAGVAAALAHTSAKWNLIVACDMPRLQVEFLRYLFEAAESSEAQAVVPVQPDGREQPLCAVYSDSLKEPFQAAVAGGVRRVGAVLEPLNVRYLAPREYARIDPSGDVFANVNTPADLHRAIRRTEKSTS